MKCIVYSGESSTSSSSNKMMVIEQQRPTPPRGQAGHVLIKVMAVGLNPVDAKQVVGDKVPRFMQSVIRKTILKNKCIPGFDFSGIVIDHDGHAGFSQGDCVFGCMPPWHGTLAEYISAPTHQVAYMPRNYSFAQAAALPLVGLTAIQCLQPYIPSRTSLETSILIIGASGGTGHVALQVARLLGAKHRTAICSMSNTDFVMRTCGATTVIDYNTNNMQTIMEQLCAAPGCPYSIVLDCVTSADTKVDSSRIDYRKLVQQMQEHNMLTDDYIHRRLGGPTLDWIRAGWERFMTGSNADTATSSSSLSLSSSSSWTAHEKLFWIRFPHSSQQLTQLAQMVEQGSSSSSSSSSSTLSNDGSPLLLYKQRNHGLRVKIQEIYPSMTAQNVNHAFQQLLQRRVQGKIVITVHDNDDNK
jgi:reticulon-4-interacting protein 1, mitochondrial